MAEPVRVALLVTCLVDLFRPSVGFAAVKLLEAAGCTVEVPRAQTCCGQPAYNSGDKADAKAIARQVIAAFAGYDYVVVPSGSCAGMVRAHYPELFADEPATLARAEELAARTYELVSFLTDVRGMTDGRGALRADRDLSRFVLRAARAARQGAAAPAARHRRGARARRTAGRGNLLRVRRDVRGQVPRNLRQDGERQGRRHRRDRRGLRARRRLRGIREFRRFCRGCF